MSGKRVPLETKEPMARRAAGSANAKLPQEIWALGLVSLFMDVSSEMIHSLLPLFLVTVLGASAMTVGAIEGIGEATASISKLFSGWLSDRLRNRKMLTVVGYGLGALAKPLFALAPNVNWVFAARFADRLGKGIRGAPRDALVGDITPAALRGAAYGLRQSLDTVGAFLGPLGAMGLMMWFVSDFRLVFSLAVVPGVISVAILILFVREPPEIRSRDEEQIKIDWTKLRGLGFAYWSIVAVGTIATLARFSEAFLILRLQGTGLAIALAPLVLIVMNIVYATSAYPVGALSDNVDRRALLGAGLAVLLLSDLALAYGQSIPAAMLGVALWGLHMGMTQGLLATLVADAAPAQLRGTAFGVFHFASGVALLLASVIAGALWEAIGHSATFLAGAAFAAVAMIGMLTTAAR
jgi:MFS family permease